MSLFGQSAVLAARIRGVLLDRNSRHVRRVQEGALRRLLARAAPTRFGEKHGFARIRTTEGLVAALPLHRYEDLRPWFERAMDGEPDVCWPGRIRYFGMSSGTTAGNKYLPISDDSVRQQQRGGFDPLACYLRWTSDGSVLEGKAIMLGGSSCLSRRASGVLVGDNTGIMAHHMPRLVARQYLPSPRVRAIDDWDTKIDALIDEALFADVRLLAGTPSWFAGLFDRLLSAAQSRGKRADTVHDLWPNLRLLTGGGINFEPYRQLIRARLGRHVPYVDIYNATEGGIMGVQDHPDELAMRLLPDNGVFYEFVPVEELTAASPRRLRLWEVETGVTYALAVSTMSGIFSYLIGDCLRFVQTFPHRFMFEGRTAAFLNVTGEHVSQGEIERAARSACAALSVQLRDFTVSADVGIGPGTGSRHVWLMEFDGPIPNLEHCATLIDRDLAAHNGDYEAHRSSGSGLLLPRVVPLRKGAFEAFMREHGKLGGQHKVPRVLLDQGKRARIQALTERPALITDPAGRAKPRP